MTRCTWCGTPIEQPKTRHGKVRGKPKRHCGTSHRRLAEAAALYVGRMVLENRPDWVTGEDYVAAVRAPHPSFDEAEILERRRSAACELLGPVVPVARSEPRAVSSEAEK